MTMTTRKQVLATVTFLLLGAGCVTYFLGCHPVIQPLCSRFRKAEGTVTGVKTLQRLCCAHKSSSSSSCDQHYFCYDGYAMFAYGANKTCSIEVRKGVRTVLLAEAYVRRTYTQGAQYHLLVDKNLDTCMTSEQAKALAIIGVVLFAAAFSTCMVFVWDKMKQMAAPLPPPVLHSV